jgi:hypothetical protein
MGKDEQQARPSGIQVRGRGQVKSGKEEEEGSRLRKFAWNSFALVDNMGKD